MTQDQARTSLIIMVGSIAVFFVLGVVACALAWILSMFAGF